MKWLLRALAFAMVLAAAGAQPPAPQKRIALVIGVADYNLNRRIELSDAAADAAARIGELPDLRNTINDARDVRDALTRIGFDSVDYLENPTAETMIVKFSEFGSSVRQAGPGAIVLVYFSGHGMQVEGENFLVPAGARMPAIDYSSLSGPAAQAILQRVAVPIALLRSQLAPREGKGVNVIVLDACRNNPWDPSTRGGGRGRGLADQQWGMGRTLISFSTDPGNTAYDGEPSDRNSPFTTALRQSIERRDLDVLRMFSAVSRAVEERTLTWRDGPQRPWINSVTVPDDVCLAGCVTPAPAPRAEEARDVSDRVDPEQADLYFWTGCCRRDGVTRADFEGYIQRVERREFPGLFREIAETRIASMGTGDSREAAPGLLRAEGGEQVAAATGALSNDPLSRYQWFLRAPGDGFGQSPGGAGFVGAWPQLASAQGAAPVIALIGTGVDPQQVDVAQSSLVAGVDVILDAARAGDGDGPDREVTNVGETCQGSPTGYSGSHPIGLIAAETNNALGVAGAAYGHARIQPIRALGPCGGALSDILNGMRWAAGLAPIALASGGSYANRTPADIIVLPLAMRTLCPASMQATIDRVRERGVVVVASAGNSGVNAQEFAPAGCNGVIAVGASTLRGELAFYSNFGDAVDVIAPGGDMLTDTDNDGRPDGVLTAGRATACVDPANGQRSETCAYSYGQGTSPSAALVAAGLALMQQKHGVRGAALEELFFSRAVRPLDPAACTIECTRNQNATPIPDRPGMCMRACGRGILDMSRAL